MEMFLHDTNICYTKMLQVEHNLTPQSAVAGNGRGEYAIVGGHPQIHPVVLELLKFDIVHHVAVDEGYFLISVSEPHRWGEIEGSLQHVVARGLSE